MKSTCKGKRNELSLPSNADPKRSQATQVQPKQRRGRTAVTTKAMKAVNMVYANTTKHDWPDDIWDAICQAIEAEKHEVSQEPVAHLLHRQDRNGYETGEKTDYGAFPVYTASQQHAWIGLTDQDCERMSAGDKVVAMWTERTLKKKNTHPQPNVTTSDMKQEHVAKTAKQRHEENI